MTTRPLELASRLQPGPRNFDGLFFVNAGLLVLFFSLFGSRFVLAPGLKIELRPMAGARATASPTTHYISVNSSGVIFINQGPVKLEGLKEWLREESTRTKTPSLLVRAGRMDDLAEIVSVATAAGFSVLWAFDEPSAGGSPK